MMHQTVKTAAFRTCKLIQMARELARSASFPTFRLTVIVFLTVGAFAMITPVRGEQLLDEMTITNGDFELASEGEIPGWAWWTREPDMGSATLTKEGAHSGDYSVSITHHGPRDLAFSNSTRFAVTQGQKLTVSAWAKCQDTNDFQMAVVALKDGELVRWDIGSDGVWGTKDWTLLTALVNVPRTADEIYVRFVGSGNVQAWVDDVKIEEGWRERLQTQKPKVDGYARQRIKEKLDRGLVAMPIEDNRVYLGWRLLESDPDNVGFHVYRRTPGKERQRLTDEPIAETCSFIDDNPTPGVENQYTVQAVVGDSLGDFSSDAAVTPSAEGKSYTSIPLQGDYTFQKAGIADLNGDGRYDYVIKQPNSNVDPYVNYWKPSPSTYKLEAYLSDGSFLWRKDLGWAIEQGIWYSPMIVYDLDGDGKAEVALKTGPDEDPRDEDGRVGTGPEYLSILDGMTGEERLRIDWPSRDGFPSYNYFSRNQICVAYLDGKTPCLIVVRGTYNLIRVRAYQYHDGKLDELWRWEDREDGGMYRGQGAHSMHAVDVDDDGRDEVFLGSAVLDDNGVGLWSSGMGHPDHHYVGDIDPSHPGLEVYYGMEVAQAVDGCWLADADTGERLWGLDESTKHVHNTGMCSDIDPRYPGMECYSGERDLPEQKWLWAAGGKLIGKTDLGGISPRTAYWDGDLQREIVRRGKIYSYLGEEHQTGVEGRLIGVADVLGDWREELIMSHPGEIRIYTTTIPAEDRRVCLMRDPIYRMDVAIQAMGYTQMPMTSECFQR
ncbi:carbohydrate binding domain-containing protein [Candidatus Poribacteria bacterium]